MLAEVNEAKAYLFERFGNAENVPIGVYAVPTETSKGSAIMRVEIAHDNTMNDFGLYKDEDSLVEDAIGADGRGHFLSSYDGYEYEEVVEVDESYEICEDRFYIYRT